VCMLTQFSRRNAEGEVRFEFNVPGFCSRCPLNTSTLSPLVEGGAEYTAIGSVIVGDA